MKNFILAVENVPKPMLIAEAVLIVLIIGCLLYTSDAADE